MGRACSETLIILRHDSTTSRPVRSYFLKKELFTSCWRLCQYTIKQWTLRLSGVTQFTSLSTCFGCASPLTPPVAQMPSCGSGRVSVSLSRDAHTWYNSSQRMIRSSHRPLPTHTTNKRRTSMPSAGFEPAIPSGCRPHCHRDRPTVRSLIETGVLGSFIGQLVIYVPCTNYTSCSDTVRKQDDGLWTELIWLMIGRSGGLL